MIFDFDVVEKFHIFGYTFRRSVGRSTGGWSGVDGFIYTAGNCRKQCLVFDSIKSFDKFPLVVEICFHGNKKDLIDGSKGIYVCWYMNEAIINEAHFWLMIQNERHFSVHCTMCNGFMVIEYFRKKVTNYLLLKVNLLELSVMVFGLVGSISASVSMHMECSGRLPTIISSMFCEPSIAGTTITTSPLPS